jgi:hypothetical protein
LFIVVAALKALLAAIEKREPADYVKATALISNAAFAFVEFSEQLIIIPEFSQILLQDFSEEIMSLIKTLVACSKEAVFCSHQVFNGLPEFKVAALELAKEVKGFLAYTDTKKI